jgi:hypothetical protein
MDIGQYFSAIDALKPRRSLSNKPLIDWLKRQLRRSAPNYFQYIGTPDKRKL